MGTTPTPDEALRQSAVFMKSTRSSGAQDCVAVGRIPGYVGVQDTKEDANSGRRTTLAFPQTVFASFLDTLKSGASLAR